MIPYDMKRKTPPGCESEPPPPRILLVQVLAHEVNVGYEGFSNMQLLSFNGERVKSLKHLVRLADESREEFLRFDLFRDSLVVLEAAAVPKATTQICKDNSIPSPRSADLIVDIDAEVTKVKVAAAAADGAPPLGVAGGDGGLAVGTEGNVEAETEGDFGGQQQQEEQEQLPLQPATGVNGGKPRKPSIAPGAAVPARRKLAHKKQHQQRRGMGAVGVAARVAEPNRLLGRRGARLRSAAAAAVRRVGARAAAARNGLRIEGGAVYRRWLARRKSEKNGGRR